VARVWLPSPKVIPAPCGTALPVARWAPNNGGWEGSYAASVAQRQAAPATTAPGAFANGATVGKQEEQFSSKSEVINSE